MSIISLFNTINRQLANLAAWVLFCAMLLTFALVVLRYGFADGSIAGQELVNYGHAFAFMLGAAYTLQADEHVRVDIFYQGFSAIQKAWVNALGTLVFLLPVAGFLLHAGWNMFYKSLLMNEGSADAGGLAFVYLLKGIIPLAMLLLIMQAFVVLLDAARLLVIRESA